MGDVKIRLSLVEIMPNIKSIKEQQADVLNFRETNSNENCKNCKYCDQGLFDKFESECKIFNIKVDTKHVCDLYCII
jgi:hypothetical protein